MGAAKDDMRCFADRLALAGRHVDRGEWAAGHAIASASQECARSGGCARREDCLYAAEMLICDLRDMLAH